MSFNSQSFLASAPEEPGVYRMYDDHKKLLYVGKAKNLKKRLASYFRSDLSTRTQRLTRAISEIEITLTQNEKEALILEHNLIKHLKPKYNVLFKDDKSYPYLWLSQHDFPRLSLYRGPRKGEGHFYGPYPSTTAVRLTLDVLQKTFQLRSCSDSFMAHRSRPCLQYQIKQCTAPCCHYVDAKAYQAQVNACSKVLKGKNEEVLKELILEMDYFATQQEYEKAAKVRDKIQALRKLQQAQVAVEGAYTGDILAILFSAETSCVAQVCVRGGAILEVETMPFTTPPYLEENEILQSFLVQHYLSLDLSTLPPEIIVPEIEPSFKALFEGLCEERGGRKIRLKVTPSRGPLSEWYQLALKNAASALEGYAQQRDRGGIRWRQLQELCHLELELKRMVCLDISHTQGDSTVASCVVFENGAPLKSAYRKFNITMTANGDDYAAMREALYRYWVHIEKHGEPLPDVVLLDGGKGQLTQGIAALEEAQAQGIVLMGIAKGPLRKNGQEHIFKVGAEGQIEQVELRSDVPAFHLLQHIRDEAHRFALKGHRSKRGKKQTHSVLEDIPGVGPKKRQALLESFGGLQALLEADVSLISKVRGIRDDLAQRIYAALHAQD